MSFWVSQHERVKVGQKMVIGKSEYQVVESIMKVPIGGQVSVAMTKAWNKANAPRYPEIPLPPEPVPCWHMKLVR
jgi:hypothetical protein